MPPGKKPCVMTSYGGIIRIRLKGRSFCPSSQPGIPSSPMYFAVRLCYNSFPEKKQDPAGGFVDIACGR